MDRKLIGVLLGFAIASIALADDLFPNPGQLSREGKLKITKWPRPSKIVPFQDFLSMMRRLRTEATKSETEFDKLFKSINEQTPYHRKALIAALLARRYANEIESHSWTLRLGEFPHKESVKPMLDLAEKTPDLAATALLAVRGQAVWLAWREFGPAELHRVHAFTKSKTPIIASNAEAIIKELRRQKEREARIGRARAEAPTP